MKIVRLPSGQRAPDEVDCISIERQPDGSYELQGTALLNCGDTEGAESVALMGVSHYKTHEQAEKAGLAWAAEQCVERLYVTDVGFDVPS